MFKFSLPKAAFISLTIHTVFVCTSYFMHLPHKEKVLQSKKDKMVEVSYRPQPPKLEPDVMEHPIIKPVQELDLKDSSDKPKDGSIPLKLAKDNQSAERSFRMYERKTEQVRPMQSVRKVTVTPIRSEKINNPAYAAYNEMVRSRIEEKVYANFSKMEAGVVYLTFILSSDGTLKASQIIEGKTDATLNLKDVSLKSLHQAKFPPFLKGMTLPEYTFNIEVQYQVRD